MVSENSFTNVNVESIARVINKNKSSFYYYFGDWAGFEDDLGEAQSDPLLDRARLMNLLERFFEESDLSTDWDSMNEAEPEMLINSLSMLCPFEPEERQALLEAETLQARREMLVTLIEYALHGGNEQKVMQ